MGSASLFIHLHFTCLCICTCFVALPSFICAFKLEQSKTQGVHRLIGLLEEHVRNLGDLVIKARIYDEAVAKIRGVTTLKLIHICVDYSTRMETILAEIRVLFDSRNRFFRGSPIALEKFPDLTDFLDLPPADLLQNL